MKTNANSHHGHRLPGEVISHGVWSYRRFPKKIAHIVDEGLLDRPYLCPERPDRTHSIP
jgi:hypothetical protein